MNKYYVVVMDNGDKWGVPASTIAHNRAEYYSSNDPDTTYEGEFNAMMEWFDANDYEFADWAKNNMNWDDVKDLAVLLDEKIPQPDFQECWINGEYEYLTIQE